MKKLLLTTTAFVMTAGVASAQGVSLSGDARMGIAYENRDAATNAKADNELSFTSRARVIFTLSGETDTGLAFGGSFRADNADDALVGTGGSVFISGEFGSLTMGDTAGAAQFINGHVAGVGLTGLGFKNEMTYLGNNTDLTDVTRPTARYDYSIDGFSVAVSTTNPGSDNSVTAIGASYSFEGFTVGAGAEQYRVKGGNNVTHYVGSAAYSLEGISVKATAGQRRESGVSNQSQYALSATGSFDAISVTAFGRRDFDKDTHIGLGASYDLGGGASIVGGVVNTNFKAAGEKSRTVADFGLSFSF